MTNFSHIISRFCSFEKKDVQPKKVHLQEIWSRYQRIQSATINKIQGTFLPLSGRYHIAGKFLEEIVANAGICHGKITSWYDGFTLAPMIRLLSSCRYFFEKFSNALRAGQLSMQHVKKLLPFTEQHDVFVTEICHCDIDKNSLWKRHSELTENKFLLLYSTQHYKWDAIYIFKSKD